MSNRTPPPAKRRTMKNVGLFDSIDSTNQPITTVAIDKIVLPEQQPRRYFDPTAMESLIASIKEHGILQPLLVRPKGDKYELVAGERRYRAAQEIGLHEIPVVSHQLDDQQAIAVALIENLQREDLNPIEETESILQLLAIRLERSQDDVIRLLNQSAKQQRGVADNVVRPEEQNLIDELFTKLGRFSAESFRTHRLPLLNLPNDIIEALRLGQIQFTKARAIAKVKDTRQRRKILKAAIAEQLSLTQIKERIAALVSKTEQSSKPQTQLKSTYQRLQKSKFWERNPKKWQQVQALLEQIDTLLEEP
ncbi:MAG: ParB/RepB/Spo0J family partition protein [Spirulinaceae cyanobacterium]